MDSRCARGSNEALAKSLKREAESVRIESEQSQDRCLQIVRVHLVASDSVEPTDLKESDWLVAENRLYALLDCHYYHPSGVVSSFFFLISAQTLGFEKKTRMVSTAMNSMTRRPNSWRASSSGSAAHSTG